MGVRDRNLRMTGSQAQHDADPASREEAAHVMPRGVWMLGLVSLSMDTSSELIHSLLPVFLTGTLGASVAAVGLIEGVAEATALITKVFSGVISDWFGRRKPLAVLGYGLAAVTKPLFALATTVEAVLLARLADRIGKGIRGAPRDALVADITPLEIRGAAFGLRQTLDTIGAVLGPMLAIAAMAMLADNIRLVFWLAIVPAVAAVAILAFGVDEPAAHSGAARSRAPIRRTDIVELNAPFWTVVAFGAVLTLARFSEAFLVLRAADAGLSPTWVPLVMVVMSLAYALSAYPAGMLSDRMDRTRLLGLGLAVLIVADVVLALSGSIAVTLVGVALWGLHMGLTQGLLAALVADAAPEQLRGTAYGLFNLVGGFSLLFASVLAGALWDLVGPSATFGAGAALTAAALVGLLLHGRSRRPID
jgi:MFS family permease